MGFRVKPSWLTIQPPKQDFKKIKNILRLNSLNTVCEESHCPNMGKCWDSGTATFMILGNICTRYCKFCAVKTGIPKKINKKEPKNISRISKNLKLNYIVLTSVTRDDLKDRGASHFADCIKELKKQNKLVEVLIPDYNKEELKPIIKEKPDVISHNIETIERLQKIVRDYRANYKKSLNTLKYIKELDKNLYTKTSLMLGLGEQKKEVIKTMKDLRKKDVNFLTLGQYLRPTKKHLEIKKYITPKEFDEYKKLGLKLGFKYIASGPFIRSSFKAGEIFKNATKNFS